MLHINLSPFPILTTERLLLRQLSMDDAADILLLRSDERVNEFLDRAKTTTLEEARDFIQKIMTGVENNETVYWAIALKENNSLIGTICLWNIVKEKHLAEIGYELMPPFQGRGLMQEAVSSIIGYVFDTMKLNIIIAVPAANNTRSIELLKRNNFELDTNFEYNNGEIQENMLIYFLIQPSTVVPL